MATLSHLSSSVGGGGEEKWKEEQGVPAESSPPANHPCFAVVCLLLFLGLVAVVVWRMIDGQMATMW